MPADILTTDTLFPELNGGESTDQKFEMVTDYLWLLREQLTYALTNLGIANFNNAQLSKLSAQITEPFSVVLAGQETQLTELRIEMGRIRTTITEVEDSVGEELGTMTQKLSAVEQTAGELSVTVSEIKQDIGNLNGDVDDLELKLTELDVTADGIRASVTRLETSVGEDLEALDDKLTGDLTELETLLRAEIDVTADGIRASVNEVEKALSGDMSDLETALAERISKIELTADGLSTTVSEVKNTADEAKTSADDAKDAADDVKDTVGTISGNYISKSSATQTASGFELSVMGTNKSGNSMTRMKMTADGLKIYNKAGVAVLDFDTESGDLEVQGTVTGSKIYGSSFYSSLNADSIGASFFLIDSNKISAVRRTSSSSMSPDGISMMMLGSTASIGFYTSGEQYFAIQRNLNAGYMAIASTVSLLIAGDTYGDRVIMQLVNGGVSIQATNGLTVNGSRIA